MKMKKFDPKLTPYIAATTTAVMLTRAGVNYFGEWGWVIGPLAGLVGSLSLAIAGSRITVIAQKRRWLAYLALGFMLVLSPIVIYLSESNPTNATIAWACFPDAAILLASVVTGQSMIASGESPNQTAPQANQQGARKGRKAKGKVASKSFTDQQLLDYLRDNPDASQQAAATHFGVTRSAIGQRLSKYKVKQESKVN
jgi:hypothetical protein